MIRFKQRVGYRGGFLILLGALDLLLSLSFFDPQAAHLAAQAPAYSVVVVVLPLWGWALAFLLVGITCLVQAWMRNDYVAFGAALTLKTLWLVFLLAALPRAGIISSGRLISFWLIITGMVLLASRWPEPSRGRK